MRLADKLVSAVKIAAQAFPPTAALSQWLSEIEAARVNERLDRLEDPLANYGPRAKELAGILYSLVQAQSQDRPTTHIDWAPELKPLIKELRQFESAGLLTGSHALGPNGEFRKGFRLSNPAFIVYLALLRDDPEKSAKLIKILDEVRKPLDAADLRDSVKLPLTVIHAFFQKYEEEGQGFKSKEIGRSLYMPKT